MKKLCLFVLGFIPLGLGCLMGWHMDRFIDVPLPVFLIGIGFLALWAFLGFVTCGLKESIGVSLCLVHLPAFFVLLLNLYQELILGRYWGNLFGIFTQYCYFPLLNISFKLTFWSGYVWTAYIASFLLMCFAYFIGFKARKQRTK